MREYRVVPMEGLQMLNGAPCRQFNVYHQDEDGVNAFMGSYLVGSGNTLYLLDLETDEAVPLEGASTPVSPEEPAPSSSASPSSSEETQTPAE